MATGNSKRPEFSEKTKTAAYLRAGRKCEECGIELRDGMRKEFDHIKTAFYGGDNSLENCRVLCAPCHGKKTYDMNSNASVISMPKTRRMHRKRAGQRGRVSKGPPMAGTRASKWKKTFQGWVRRDEN